MALSGTLNSSSYDGKYIQFSWSATQSITDNTSTITWTLKGAGGSGEYHTSGAFYLKINGNVVLDNPADGTGRIDLYDGTEISNGSLTVSHNSDGSKSFSVEIAAGIYAWARNCSGSATFSLNTIARTSTIAWRTVSGSDNQTAGTKAHMLITRHNENFAHLIKYQFGSVNGTIVSRSDRFDSTLDWTIPMPLLNQIPKSTSGTGKITCTTYNGDTSLGSKTLTLTVKAPDSVKPSVGSITVTNTVSGEAASVIKKWGVYVAGYSSAKLAATATGSYSSTISSFTLSGSYSESGVSPTSKGNLSYTGSVLSSGTKTFKVKAKDSRGRWSDIVSSASIKVYSYSAPKITYFTVQRDSDDATKILISNAWSYSSVNGNNTATATLFYKASSESAWSTYGTIEAGSDIVLDGTFDSEKSYDFKLSVVDALSKAATKTVSTTTAPVLLDFREGGKGLGVGKIAESDSLEVGLPAHFMQDVYIHTDNSSSYKTLYKYIQTISLPSFLNSGSVSGVGVASGAWKIINKVTLEKGFYSGAVYVQITSNTSGIRGIAFAPSSSDTSDLGNLQVSTPGHGTYANRIVLPITAHITSSTEYAIWAYQNSGTSLTARGRYSLLYFSEN